MPWFAKTSGRVIRAVAWSRRVHRVIVHHEWDCGQDDDCERAWRGVCDASPGVEPKPSVHVLAVATGKAVGLDWKAEDSFFSFGTAAGGVYELSGR